MSDGGCGPGGYETVQEELADQPGQGPQPNIQQRLKGIRTQ